MHSPAHSRKRFMTALVALAAAVPLLIWGCAGEEPTTATVPGEVQSSRTVDSASPASTYGIDEVVNASLRLETQLPVWEEARPEPPADLSGNEAFMLPELGISPGDGRNHLREGETLHAEGSHLEAAAHLAVAAEESPDSWYVRYLLGLSLWKAGDLDGAEESLWRAAELNVVFPKTFVNLSRVLNEAGRFGEALAAADRVLALEPAHAAGLHLRGRALANLGRHQEAEASLRASIEAEPGNGYVHNRLGLLLIRLNRFEEAVPILQTAAEMLPDVAFVHNNLGIAYENTGRPQDAVQQYAAGLEIDGESPRLTVNLDRARAIVGEDLLLASGDELPATGSEVVAVHQDMELFPDSQ